MKLGLNKLAALSAAMLVAGSAYAAEPSSVLASSDDGNVASNTLDNNLDTRWSANGNDGSQWIRYDFGSETALSAMKLAFFKGDQRNSYFQIQSSDNASSWSTIVDTTSAGNTADLETFSFGSTVSARYFRVVGFGNSSNTWNSITEAEFVDGEINEPTPVEGELTVERAFDDGTSHSSYPASNAVDGSTAWASRWAAEAGGDAVNLTLELAEAQNVSEVGVAWGRGDQRTHTFEIYARPGTSGTWTKVYDSVSSGDTTDVEIYDVTDITAKQVRVKAQANSAGTNWMNITEVKLFGGEAEELPELDPNKAPSENFDLADWYLSIPVDEDGSGTADSIKGDSLQGYEHSEFFYTAADGGMVFKAPIEGAKTSTNTSFTRTELREMLTRGASSDTKNMANNWVFSSAPQDYQDQAGGVDGVLRATLAVNHVTTTGEAKEAGRVIIGQIHAPDDEPVRIYYRKNPGNELGTIYIAHEPERTTGLAEVYEIFYGDSRTSGMPNPEDGIALNEKFTYEIKVVGNMLYVTIIRDGREDITKEIDMAASGYDVDGQYMYFKAGVYNQNKTGDADDYVQATFYSLENSHNGYSDK